MSSISVRFNSFSFLYSIFNEHNSVSKDTVVGLDGFEPSTSRLSGARSNHLSYRPFSWLSLGSFLVSLLGVGFPTGGDDGVRTHDPLLAGQVLSQLSYTPIWVPSGSLSFQGSL